MSWRNFYSATTAPVSNITEAVQPGTPQQVVEQAAATVASMAPIIGIDGEALLASSFDKPLPPPIRSDGTKLCESVHRFLGRR